MKWEIINRIQSCRLSQAYFDRPVYDKLSFYMEMHKYLSKYQSGFRKYGNA